ncbi:unnamed protein product [Amoebophrya sp. A25]|nr:unnamed protein product [Amoebophrya sp. A25]|eukprot:GSA25T00007520001.1
MAPIEELLQTVGAAGPGDSSSVTAGSVRESADAARRQMQEALEGLTPAEVDSKYGDFLKNVDDVTQKVQDIISGKITDFDAFDKEQSVKDKADAEKKAIEDRIRQLRKEEAAEKQQKVLLQGRDGKGQGDDYLLFCKFCFTEYLTDSLDKCTRCGKEPLMTQAERKKELMFKLENYKEEKAKHQVRKDKWLRWKKSQALLGKSKVINYKAWEFWEPDSDNEDEENAEPVLPKDDPQFKALDADMKKRKKERIERYHQAMKCKDEGNKLLQAGEYTKAIEMYKDGLEYQKDMKPLWTNRALAEVKVYRYEDAASSASKVLELCEIFEDGFEKSKDMAFKAFSRRAMAYRGLHKWKEAVEDLKEAIRLEPHNKDARELLRKTKEAAAEARYSDEVEQRLREENQKRAEFLKKQGFVPAEMEEDAAKMDEIGADEEGGASGGSASKQGKRIHIIDEDSSDEEQEDGGSSGGGAKGSSNEIEEEKTSAVAVVEKRETLLPAEGEEEASAEASVEAEPNSAASGGSQSASSRLSSATPISDMDWREYLTLLVNLEKKKDERVLFCKRRGDKSRLDGLISELDTMGTRWRKATGSEFSSSSSTSEPYAPVKVADGAAVKSEAEINSALAAASSKSKSAKKKKAAAADADDKAAAAAADGIKRIIKLLLPLCCESDFHCELCAPAARYLWPVIAVAPYDILQVMDHMSQRSQSCVAIAEYALRYPEKLGPFFEVLRVDSKENVLPPNVEDILQKPEQAMKDNGSLDAMLRPSARDLVLAVLCNMQLHSKMFRTVLVAEKELIIDAIAKKIELMNWKSNALNLLCNVVANEMGKADAVFTKLAVERCLGKIIDVLKDYAGNTPMLELFPPSILTNMKEQYLGVMVNLVNVSTEARPIVGRKSGFLKFYLNTGTEEAKMRAANVAQKVFLGAPDSLSDELRDLCFEVLSQAFAFQGSTQSKSKDIDLDDEAQMKQLETYVKLGTTLITKVPSFQRLFLPLPGAKPELDPRKILLPNLVKIVCIFRPSDYVRETETRTNPVIKMQSNCRGNLAVLFEWIVNLENKGGASFPSYGLGGVVEPFIEYLRKENGSAQKNAGICVTKLAQSERYRPLVRTHHGFESLQQIQLGLVQKEKEKPVPRPDWKPLTRGSS